MRKRILLIHRYYYPDTPTYAYLLHRIALKLADDFNVNVLTSFPSYYGSNDLLVKQEETIGNVHVYRVKLLNENKRKLFLRLLNAFIFSSRIFFFILRNRKEYDFVQIATTPPILPALAVRIATKIVGIKYIYHCQDIYPDSVVLDKPKSFFYRIITRIDKLNMKYSYRVVVLSNDMKRHIVKERGIDKKKIVIINNFVFNRGKNTEEKLPLIVEKILKEKKEIVLFAGNLGLAQNLDIIFKSIAELLEKKDFYFLVIGEGIIKQELMLKYKSNNIIFLGYQTIETIQSIYEYVKFGIAPINEGIEKVAFPSKIISYLVAGVPVLSFSSSDSEIAQLVNNNFGMNYSFNGKEHLKKIILELLDSHFDRTRIIEKSNSIFKESISLNKWVNLYKVN